MSDKTPTKAEFDAWTPETEHDALAAIGEAFHVRHIIKGETFWALAPNGKVYKLPLGLSIKDFEALSAEGNSDVQSISAVKDLIRSFAGPEQAESLEAQPVQVVMNILNQYGTVIRDSQGADLGK
ncbi:hypothetical protein PG2029B_1070 [Bifidobacterium pseudolongum subsp. globosum]|uniref:ATP-dependent serine Clp protease n=1 Tax=Bifidobacterium pseudolongum subsp. globosum TaxID=1690 RepID=A0A4Q5AG16_9BIFI|nr:hypothetical protein [Bifidobacterium pseudolongum]RYQ26473.1 hypothetical protein PG2032B_1069 [Bifidobacterium pseudolongum subsp. globosum]RYQ28465.1 hypothetical protein PG2029B_1070 [Bifidobacterium pseudolongum subsp. globosum]